MLLVAALGFVVPATMLPAATLTHNGEDVGWTDSSGTDWLRLDNAVLGGLSLADYQAGITAYGQTWELATRAEIADLWAEFEPLAASGVSPYTPALGDTQAPYTPALGAKKLLLDAFGYTYRSTTGGVRIVGQGYSADAHKDIQGNLLWQYAPRIFIESEGSLGGTTYYSQIWNVNNPTIGSGTAWMRAGPLAPVPLPASLPLFLCALGLAGTALARRKRFNS